MGRCITFQQSEVTEMTDHTKYTKREQALLEVATERLEHLSQLAAFIYDDVEEGWPTEIVELCKRYTGAAASMEAVDGT